MYVSLSRMELMVSSKECSLPESDIVSGWLDKLIDLFYLIEPI